MSRSPRAKRVAFVNGIKHEMTEMNWHAFHAGQALTVNPEWGHRMRFFEHIVARTDTAGLVWLLWPVHGQVPVRRCPTLRGALNAFLSGYGAHGEYRVLWSTRDLHPLIAFKVADKWRTRDWIAGRWVPVMPGRLSTHLAFTLFQRGEQPVFVGATTVVAE